MGFFFQQVKSEADKRQKVKGGAPSKVIPLSSLQELGCRACPRAKAELKNPKMLPTGSPSARIVILGPSPTLADDRLGEYLTDKAHDRLLLSKIPRHVFDREVALLGLAQCAGEEPANEVVTACCRNRVLADIEAIRPLVVITIGTEALSWATGLTGGPARRSGRFIPTWFGKHQAWVMAFPDSDWKGLAPRKFGYNQHVLSYDFNLNKVLEAVKNRMLPPGLPDPATYRDGLEIITGQNPGDIERVEAALLKMEELPDTAIDYETRGLRPYREADPRIWTVAIGTFSHVVAFPLDHPDAWPDPRHRARAWYALARFLVRSGSKIAHNLSHEHIWSAWFFGNEILYATDWKDTMAQAHTLDERKGTKSIDDCTRMHFGFFLKSLTNVDPVRLLEYPIAKALEYNALDSKWCYALNKVQQAEIEATPSLIYEARRKERLSPALVITELLGLPCDKEYAKELDTTFGEKSKLLAQRIAACPEVRAYERTRPKFEPSSPDQVLVLMNEVCKRPEVRKEEEGGVVSYTTDEEALASIPSSEVPSAPLILELRGCEKLRGTYLGPILSDKIVHADGCMHPVYNSMEAETGRLASEEPNGQNWPKRKFKEVRGVVAAEKGRIFVAKDYGQIEARVFGMASEDQNLVRALWTDYDIHGYWGNRIFKEHRGWIDYLRRTFEEEDENKLVKIARQEAKNKWVFPMFFGSAPKSCANNLHIPIEVADKLSREFWDEFKGVKRWQDKILSKYEKNLYVETLTGRRRRGAMTKNQVINAPIQGTAADIVLEAMIAMSLDAVISECMTEHPRLNVHDDLSAIPLITDLERHVQRSAELMCEHRFDFINVPLLVEIETGPRWSELKPYGKFRSDQLFNIPNPYAK